MPFSALLDACVLFPVGVRDTLLSVAETGIYRVLWSEAILTETRTAILRRHTDLESVQLDRTFDAMRSAFPDALVDGYQALTDAMTNDPGDRHVLAAAVAGGAQVIVTINARHFPSSACDPYGIDVQSPDEFLAYAFELAPERVIAALAHQAAKRRHPPATFGELLDILAASGLPELTTSIRRHLARVAPDEQWVQDLELDGVDIGTQGP